MQRYSFSMKTASKYADICAYLHTFIFSITETETKTNGFIA